MIIIVSFAFVTSIQAKNSENIFYNYLGISIDGNYSNEEIAKLETGTVIQGVVVDPDKIGGCERGDIVVATKIEPDTWRIKHWKTGQTIIAKAVDDQGNLKFKKIGSMNPSTDENKLKYNNVMIKLGAYIPNNDIEEADTGFFGQITYNRYLNKNFAFEIGGGSFFTSGEGIFKDSFDNEVNVSGDLYVYNFLLNLKLVIPMPIGELYAGAGPGLYLIYANQDGTYDYIDDYDTVFGGQAVAGINFNLTEIVFLGIEGQYIFTGDAEFSDGIYSKSFNINGYNVSGVIGFRF
jgi:hypothetical protein